MKVLLCLLGLVAAAFAYPGELESRRLLERLEADLERRDDDPKLPPESDEKLPDLPDGGMIDKGLPIKEILGNGDVRDAVKYLVEEILYAIKAKMDEKMPDKGNGKPDGKPDPGPAVEKSLNRRNLQNRRSKGLKRIL